MWITAMHAAPGQGCSPGAGMIPPDHKQELAMKIDFSNESRELSVDELNIVSGGGLFSLVLRITGNNLAATVYERSGAPDVPVGLPK
jgi:hypothetical protein